MPCKRDIRTLKISLSSQLAAQKKAGVYDEILKERGLNSVELAKRHKILIMDCIYKGVKAGKLEEYVPVFYEVLSNIEADVYIAGCTEIPMFYHLLAASINL